MRRSDVVHAALLKSPRRSALVSEAEISVNAARSKILHKLKEDKSLSLPVVGELQCHLHESVRTAFARLHEIFAEFDKAKNFDVGIVHEVLKGL